MPGPLRILVLNLTAEMGGAERSLAGLARAIDRDRFGLTLAVPHEGPLSEAFREAGHDAFADGIGDLAGRSPLDAAALLGRLRREIRGRRIGLIHSNGIWRMNRAAALSIASRIPAISHVRDLDPGVLGGVKFRFSARVMRKLVAISNGVRETLVRGGVPAAKVETIHNGIDLAAFRPTPVSAWMRRDWAVPEGAFLAGIVGQVEPRKGHLDFVRAARSIAAAEPTARFVIVGGDIHGIYGDYKREVEGEIATMGLTDRFAFAGIVETIPAAMGALDVLVVPSTSEPFGRVAVEAMAARRPVVAYRVGGLPEIVEEGETGLLVPPGDVDALAAAVLSLARDRTRAAAMGEAGRARAERLFGLEAHVRAMERLYASCGLEDRARGVR